MAEVTSTYGNEEPGIAMRDLADGTRVATAIPVRGQLRTLVNMMEEVEKMRKRINELESNRKRDRNGIIENMASSVVNVYDNASYVLRLTNQRPRRLTCSDWSHFLSFIVGLLMLCLAIASFVMSLTKVEVPANDSMKFSCDSSEEHIDGEIFSATLTCNTPQPFRCCAYGRDGQVPGVVPKKVPNDSKSKHDPVSCGRYDASRKEFQMNIALNLFEKEDSFSVYCQNEQKQISMQRTISFQSKWYKENDKKNSGLTEKNCGIDRKNFGIDRKNFGIER